MIRTVLLGLLLFVADWSYGQTPGDSARLLLDADQPEKALEAVIQDLKNAPENEQLHILKGDIHTQLGKYENAAESYLKAIELEEKLDNPDRQFLAKAYRNYGESCYFLHQFQRSIRICKKGLSYLESDISSSEAADLNYNLSSSFARLGQYDSAMVYLEKVYKYDLVHGDSAAIAADLNSMGYMQFQSEDYEKALEYYWQALNSRPSEQERQVAMGYSNIGVANIHLKRFKEADKYLTESYDRYAELGDSVKMVSQLVHKSMLFRGLGKNEEALRFVAIADRFFSNKSDNWNILRTKLQLAEIYYSLKKNDQALAELDIVIVLCTQEKLLEELVNAYDLRVKIFDAMNSPRLAYAALKKKVTLADSLQKEKQVRELSELELKFVTQQKENEIDILKLRNQLNEQELIRKKKDNLYLTIGILLLTIFAVVVVLLQRQKHKLQNDLYSKEIDELRLQIGTLLGEEVVTSEFTAEEINNNLKEPLSEREFEILQAISSNQTNKEIADSLFISINTVKFHLKKVYEKLGVANRKEAIHFLIKSSSEK